MGRFLVRRHMREMNLVAIQPKRYKPRTTDSDHDKLISPNLLRRAAYPLTWGVQIVGDITYVPLIDGGFVYMATFQDRKTKRVVGRSIAASLEAKELVVKALQMALRQGLIKRGAIVHTDRGSQYVSKEYRDLLKRCGLRQSMSGKGNCYDNAQAESFFSRFKAELVTADTLNRSGRSRISHMRSRKRSAT
jgi:transposase InsO family protein